jgi:acyl-CoA reductase-like NAD-dependent aldehyde dehydrogenase
VVLKPSSSAPLTALLLADIIAASPLPQGSFNVVPCAAGEAGQLITDERIKMLSFTGSPEVGWGIKRKAGKKKVVLELGGNAGVVVDRDANLDYAVKRIVQGSYGNAGQSCIAVQRIYVHEALYEEFENRFVDASKALYVGDPSDEHTIVGPMIDEAAARKVEQWVHEAASGGAQILCGGKRKGAILEPTILVNVKPEMSVSCREVFAPVVTLDRFSDFREAVKAVNRSVFGLQAGVFTNDVNNVFVAYSELEVGGVIVNDYPTYRIDHMPYGGVKDSGFGREGIAYAMEEMSELKLLAFNFV